jgi:hypothetical protein
VTATAPAFGRITSELAGGTDALRHITSRLGIDRVLNGGWFRKLAVDHIRRHNQRIGVGHWDRVYPRLNTEQRADAIIKRVCQKASVAGAFASAGASTGELLSLFTEGLGAPVGVPAIVVSMCGEAAYTAMLQIDLACDLGSVYGVTFDVDDIGDLTTLFALALELPPHAKKPADGEASAAGLIARLVELEDGEVARRLGRKMLEDSVMRNFVPVVGIAISARWNYVATRRLAGTVRRYVRYRRALREAMTHLQIQAIAEPELVAEGAWLLSTVDGVAPGETAMVVGLVLDALPVAARQRIHGDRTFGDDEDGWFTELAKLPRAMHSQVLDVLYLVAAADRELAPSERRFLHRVGKTIGIDVDLERVENICRHLALGEEMEAGPVCGARAASGA